MVAEFDSNEVQIFLKNKRNESEILPVLNEAFGFIIQKPEDAGDEVTGFLPDSEYTQGYQQGLCIVWRLDDLPARPLKETLSVIATGLKEPVLCEVTDKGDMWNEEWLLTLPDGTQKLVETIEYDDGIDVVEE